MSELMRVYIQTDKHGEFYNVNAYIAATGFKALGYEINKYVDTDEIIDLDRSSIFVGGVGMIRKRLSQLGIDKPDEKEYPNELKKFLNRKVWKANLNEIIKKEQIGVFIKPVKTKMFEGKVINRFADYIGLNYTEEVEVWCSEVVNIITEWRCFIRYREILDIRYYKGAWDSSLDLKIVRSAISQYNSQPNAYCLDFGVDSSGKHYLIEVNDGHSLGTYGMGAISYAKFLSARWSELTKTEDSLNF